MKKTGNWSTKFELNECKGDFDPPVFNFHAVREGGHLGHSDYMATYTLDEVKELQKLFKTTLDKHRKRIT